MEGIADDLYQLRFGIALLAILIGAYFIGYRKPQNKFIEYLIVSAVLIAAYFALTWNKP